MHNPALVNFNSKALTWCSIDSGGNVPPQLDPPQSVPPAVLHQTDLSGSSGYKKLEKLISFKQVERTRFTVNTFYADLSKQGERWSKQVRTIRTHKIDHTRRKKRLGGEQLSI
jgi:hypothetical protein